MPGFPREELEEMVRRWVAANAEAGRSGVWSPMAEFYTDDALYTWNNGPRHEFVARGRQQIRDWVFGTEMEGLEHWTYPYVRVLIDERQGEVLGLWRQIAPVDDPDGQPYEIAGTGGPGSATPATTAGAGSATSSTTPTRPPRSSPWRRTIS